MGEEGVKVGGRGVQPWPRDVLNLGVNVSSVRAPQGRSVPAPPAPHIGRVLINEPDTVVSTSPVPHFSLWLFCQFNK